MADFDLFKHFTSIQSTNQYCTELIAKSNPLPFTVISTDFQSNGVGQIGSKWISNIGENVLMSIILYPDFINANESFKLHFLTSLSCVEVLRQYIDDDRIQIKWPNDILVDRKKIVGMLIKNTFSGHSIKNAIVGIGLNVNQTDFDQYLFSATSIASIIGRPLEVDTIRLEILENIKKFFELLKSNHSLKELYLHSLYGYDELFNFFDLIDQTYKVGKITDVLRDGRLIVDVAGSEVKYEFKQIKFLING
ncbi:biotin--[acetyl-CoA-carboxylase] ligase [Membranihabitans marinus]|uniref:biotin--[acetyl-CoA-carboxylase] ligase n=1 Tax=Membranihabitans marinus TaxID=1227546 RepID=UPI001F0160C6|nr:biotin--[acetyl-CoA-carboxylase] ligase [Membranihabitans marinus]